MENSELSDFGQGAKPPASEHCRVKGRIRRVSEYPTKEGKSPRYYIWLDGAENCYSGFYSAPGVVGDTIDLEYEEYIAPTGKVYYNIKKIINVESTHTEATAKDQKNYNQEEMRIAISRIVGLAIQYWMQRNLPSSELQITTERFLRLAHLWEDYIEYNEKVTTTEPKGL